MIQLLGPALGLAYLSGINLYAAVLAIGLGTRFGIFQLPEQVQGLAILSEPYVIAVAGLLFLVEFFADKIPWVDSIWDAIHTFIRPVGAAVLGVVALGDIGPVNQTVAALVLGGVGLSSHASKSGARLLINQSPEPFTNIAMSLAEDVVVIGGVYMATAHPVLSFWFVASILAITAIFFPKMIRLIRLELSAISAIIKTVLRAMKIVKGDSLVSSLPDKFDSLIPSYHIRSESDIYLLLFTGKGVKIGHKKFGTNYRGYLSVIDGHLTIHFKKRFKIHNYVIVKEEFSQCEFKKGILLDRLNIRYENRIEKFQLPKGQEHLAVKFISIIHGEQPQSNSEDVTPAPVYPIEQTAVPLYRSKYPSNPEGT